VTTPFNTGAFVWGAPDSPRALVRHAELFTAYADGVMAERGEDGEAYLSHFVFGEELQRYYASNRHSVKGFAGPCCCHWLVWDVDRDDLTTALKDTCQLAWFLSERYHNDPIVFYSGRRGFHIVLELAHRPKPSTEFPAVAKTFATELAATVGVKIDLGIYDRNHLVRAPNTKHPATRLYKRRIDTDDLFRIDIDGVRRHAEQPAGDGLPRWRGDTERLAADWATAEAATARATEARAERRATFTPDERAPKYVLDLLRFGAAEGERATMLFRSAAWMAEQGAPPSLVSALLTEPALDCGLTPSETARQIRCGIEHAQKQRAAADPRPDPVLDPDAFERWAIEHETDLPLPPGATDFPFGATQHEGGPA
jgi:hypothetical protein